MEKKKRSQIILGVAVIVLIALVVSFSGNNTSAGNVEIGIMTPLSGDASVWGEEVQKGAQIAQDDIQKDMQNGNSEIEEVQVVYEDTQCDGSAGISALRKLTDTQNVKLTGGTVCSPVALSIAPILEETSTIHLSAGATNPQITDAGESMFRIWPSDSLEGKKIAEYAENELGVNSASILHLNNDYGVGLKDAFDSSFSGDVSSVESFSEGASDFRTQLTKINSEDVDAIYVASNPGEMPRILNQMEEMGIDKTILANGPAMQAKETLNNSGDSANGVYYAQPQQNTKDFFKDKYENKYGEEAGFASDLGYDVTMLLYEAAKSCGGDEDLECIRNQLYSVENYEGASSNITINDKGDVIVPFVIKKIENGEAKVV